MERQWKNIYILGGVSTIIDISGILLNVIIVNMAGSKLSELPQTAIDRFPQHNT